MLIKLYKCEHYPLSIIIATNTKISLSKLDPEVRFYIKTSGRTLYFTDDGFVFDLLRGEKDAGKGADGAAKGRQTAGAKTDRLVFNLTFENARKGNLIEGLGLQNAGINYFVGNDKSKWKTGGPHL